MFTQFEFGPAVYSWFEFGPIMFVINLHKEQ